MIYIGSSRGQRLVIVRRPHEVGGVHADVRETQTRSLSEIALQREVPLERVWFLPSDRVGRAEVRGPVGAYSAQGADGGSLWPNEGRSSRRFNVIVSIGVRLERSGERVVDGTQSRGLVSANPAAQPVRASAAPRFMTAQYPSVRPAPSAMRMASSRRRCATRYDMTPNKPISARANAINANESISTVVKRRCATESEMSSSKVVKW